MSNHRRLKCGVPLSWWAGDELIRNVRPDRRTPWVVRTTYGDDRRTSILGPQALDDSVRLVECTDTSGHLARGLPANPAVSVVELPAEGTGSAGMQPQEPQG
jgi:hypothetical protein